MPNESDFHHRSAPNLQRTALQVLKQLSVEGDPDEQRSATEHLGIFAPHLTEGHEERFRDAESWKSFATEKFPHIVKAEAYKAARKELRSYGVQSLVGMSLR